MMGRGRIEADTEGPASDLEVFRGRKESWHEPWLFLYAVRLAAHVSNGLKSRIRQVVGRI